MALKFADINKNELKFLTDYNGQQQKHLIEQAIKENLLFYIIYVNNKPLAIEASDVARMKAHHPKKVNLNFQNFLSESCTEVINDGAHCEEYCWKSVCVEEKIANQLLGIRANINNSFAPTSTLYKILMFSYEKYWLNHNPISPPKREIIIQEIREEYGLSEKSAEEIDSVMRPDEYRSGGNRTRK
jgi:hypothetical protein